MYICVNIIEGGIQLQNKLVRLENLKYSYPLLQSTYKPATTCNKKKGCHLLGPTAKALQYWDKTWESLTCTILNQRQIKIFKCLIFNADFIKLNKTWRSNYSM